MKVLVILLLASAASAGLIGSKKCTWGPTYWCQGFQTSRECFATSHCIKKVWSQRQLPQDNDEVCTICKNMVKQARDTLRSDETQEELKEVFEGSCALIPLKPIVQECDKLVDQFIPELVETLSSEMNPDLVCATAGLCNSARIDKMLAEANPIKTDCDVCKTESKAIGDLIRNTDMDTVVDKMLDVCGHFSSYSDACRMTVLDNFEIIYKTISELDEGVCHLSGMCSETFQNVPAVYSSNKHEDIQCEFCEKVIQHWIDTWTANTTEEEFKTVLDSLCKKLDKPSRVSHCLHIVDDWYLPWFNYLLHEVQPSELCGFVGLCKESDIVHIPLTKLSQANRLTGNDEANYAKEQYHAQLDANIAQGRLIGGYFAPKTVVATSKPGCAICEYTLHKLEDFLANDKTEANIEAGLHQICSHLPNAVEGQCDHFVNTYAPALVQLIVHDFDSSEICARLELCTSDLLAAQASAPTPALQMLRRETESCTLCEYGLETVLSVLNDTSNQEMVKNVLDQMCYKLMPHSLRNECEKLVAEYTNIIIDLVVQDFTADQICSKIKLCKGEKFEVMTTEPEEETELSMTVGDEKCVFCEYAISTLDKIIGDDKNEAKIKAGLEKLCSYMPGKFKAECTNYVDTYSDLIIDMLTHDLTPDQICQQLKLCPPATNEVPVEEVDAARPYCTLCEYAIGEVDKLIQDKQNEEEIKNVLDRICYELSIPIRKECLSMVDQYTDEIIQLFVADYTPQQVCAEIKLCNPATEEFNSIDNEIIMSNELPPIEEEETKETSENGACVLCEFVVEVAEDKILNNRTFDMTKRAVQMVCSYMPESIAEKCEEFVDEYGDQLIELIVEEELEPKQFCSQLNLCKKQVLGEEVVGKHPCVWGPAFWCQSPFHAKACGTTEHCKRYVWNN